MANVYDTLVARLQPVIGDLPLSLLNKGFDSKGKDRYVRATLLKGESFNTGFKDGYLTQTGQFVIELFSRNGLGNDFDLAEQIRGAFAERALALPVETMTLRVLSAWTETPQPRDTYTMHPIYVKWQMPER